MFRKNILKGMGVVAIGLTALSGNTIANTITQGNSYVGIGMGVSKLKPVIGENSNYTHSGTKGTAARLIIGQRFNTNMSAELGIAKLGKAKIKNTADVITSVPYSFYTLGANYHIVTQGG